MRKWSVMKKSVILLLIVSLLSAASVVASNQESIDRLAAAALVFVLDGWDVRDNVNGKYLSQGNSYTFRTTLLSGYQYALVGAGDSTVRDLDIRLYDENWNLMDRDTMTDAVPIVKVRPRWSGTFYVQVKMYRGHGYSNVAIAYY